MQAQRLSAAMRTLESAIVLTPGDAWLRHRLARLYLRLNLPREALPTAWLTLPEVWEALLADMPMTAMLRNLATMTRLGLLSTSSAATQLVVDRLTDGARLHKARIHPVAVLAALLTYRSGHSARASGSSSDTRRNACSANAQCCLAR